MNSSIRVVVLSVSLGALAVPAGAEVRMVVRADGTRAIYNVVGGSGRSFAARGTDYGWLARQRNRVSKYDSVIEKHSRAFSIDPILVKAVIQVESNFNALCTSNKGARGLMQLMPETARRFKVASILDPEQNIRGGVAYLSFLLSYFPNDLPRVLAAYNAGENAVLRHGGIPPYSETQDYVRRALTVYYGRPYNAGGTATSFRGSGKGVLHGGYMKAQPQPNGRRSFVASSVLPVRSRQGSANLR